MPWSTKDVVHHNKRAAKSSKARKVWVKVANAQLSEHGDEGRAIRIANSVADKVHASELTNYSTVNAPVDNSNPESKKMQSKPQTINTPAKDEPMTHDEILNEAVNDAEHLFTTRVNYSGKQDMENNSQNPHETNDPDRNTRMLASKIESMFDPYNFAVPHRKSFKRYDAGDKSMEDHDALLKKHGFEHEDTDITNQDFRGNTNGIHRYVKYEKKSKSENKNKNKNISEIVHVAAYSDPHDKRENGVHYIDHFKYHKDDIDGEHPETTEFEHFNEIKKTLGKAKPAPKKVESASEPVMASFDLGFQADEAPIVIAADGVSRYTTAKIARDHEKFKDVIAKHYHATDKRGRKVAPKFGWRKIFTRQNAIHEFSHNHPVAPKIKIRRKHIDGKASYVVHVKMPHLDAKGKPTGKHIFNRKVVTSSPSRVLHQMLTHARIAQSTGKQYRGPKPT